MHLAFYFILLISLSCIQYNKKCFYCCRVIFEKTNTNTSARVVHWESHAVGSPVAIVSASTREPAIRAQLYRLMGVACLIYAV